MKARDALAAVPPALFAPPPAIRARSDFRRGVVLMMVGFGLMIFFGACNGCEEGLDAGAVPIIPMQRLLEFLPESRR